VSINPIAAVPQMRQKPTIGIIGIFRRAKMDPSFSLGLTTRTTYRNEFFKKGEFL